MDLGVLIRFAVVVAILVALAAAGRAIGRKRGYSPAPPPISPPLPMAPGVRRGFARTHPWTLLLIIVVTLFVVTVGPYIVFIGGLWLACRGGAC